MEKTTKQMILVIIAICGAVTIMLSAVTANAQSPAEVAYIECASLHKTISANPALGIGAFNSLNGATPFYTFNGQPVWGGLPTWLNGGIAIGCP